MGCAASTGPLYRDEHDFATTAAYYDRDDDVKKDWVENEQLGEGMFARVVKVTRKSTGHAPHPDGQRRGIRRGQARVVRGVTRAFHSLPLCIVRIWYPHLVPAATPLQ